MSNRILLLAALLMLGACREDQSANQSARSAEEARIQKEVARRVEVVENDLKTRQVRLHTIRLLGFILLAGGAVAGLLWVRQARFPNTPVRPATRHPVLPEWSDHYQPGSGRVIDPLSGDRPDEHHPHHPPKP